jgi:parallel beta-helix repeat protein
VADSDGTNDPTETDFSHNRVIDCLEHGIKIYPGGHGSQVTHNIINAAEDRGIYVQGANRVRVIGNEVNGASTTGIFMGDSGDAGADCVVDDNTINGILIGDSGGDGILVWNHSNVKVTNNTVTNCERHGIQIYDSSVANVCGNNCDTNGQNGGGAGIAYYQSPYGTCSNNICTDNDSWGIYLRDGAGSACTHIVLSGNYCDDLGSGDQDYGILSDNDSNYLTLAGNDLSGNVVSAYSLVGSNNTIVAASHTQITLGPFYLNDVQGTAGPQVMSLGYFNTATAVSQDTANLLKVPAACKAVALLVVSDSDWTAGTADVYISVNGAAGTSINGNLVRLSTTNRETHYYATTHDSGLAFTAGQTIQLQVDTTGWTPTTANFTAWVTISLD